MPGVTASPVDSDYLGTLPDAAYRAGQGVYGNTGTGTGSSFRKGFVPQDIPGLLAFYDADDITSLWQNVGMSTPVSADSNPIANWNDRSGNAAFYDLTCLSGLDVNRANYRATGVSGLPAVDFVGAAGGGDSCLLNTSFSQTLGAYTMIFTGILYESNPGLHIMSLAKTGENPWQGTNGMLVQFLSTVSMDVEGSTDLGNPAFPSKAIDNTNPHLFVAMMDATTPGAGTRTAYIHVDGGSAATDTGTATGSTMTLNKISVGDNPAGGAPCRSKIRQLLIYSGRLTTAQLQQVGTYLQSRTPTISLTKFA